MAPRIIWKVATLARLTHREAMRLAEVEYLRFADLLDELSAEDWSRRTCCPGWTVRDMTGHVLGGMRASAAPREQWRQIREARRRGGSLPDGLTAVQVAAVATLSADEVRREIRSLVAPAIRGRRWIPAPVRLALRLPVHLPVSGIAEKWTIGHLVDEILTRDVWMHRSDICEATDRPFVATTDHDARIIQLAVADWTRRHGRGSRLTLQGPAGGTLVHNGPQPATEMSADAVEFCRTLSGRGTSVPFDTEVPF